MEVSEGLRTALDGWDLCQELWQGQPPSAVWGQLCALTVHSLLLCRALPHTNGKSAGNSPQTKNAKTFLPNYERDAALL